MDNTFINRELANVIIDAAKYFSVITLTGPRQSGKTTLLKEIFNNLSYYSLENLNIREFANNDPIAFLNQNKEGMILDEVHNAPHLLSYIQGIVDEDSNRRFVLSGSSQFAMLSKISQSLAGRTAIFELLPLSYSEVRENANLKSIDEILINGFYPAIYAEKNIAKYLYQSYTKTYLEKDVRDLLQVKDMLSFQTFLKLCAGRIGSIFNALELSNEVGVSSNTIKSWLSILEASYIIKLLPPYFENTRKRLTKSSKLYFLDTGLACYLLGIESAEQLQTDRMRGNLFENFIVVEALKNRYNLGKDSNLYFYRDSNQNEVDLLIKNRDSLNAIEIKSSATYHRDFEKGLKYLKSAIKTSIQNSAIVYNGDFESTEGDIKIINYKNFKDLL